MPLSHPTRVRGLKQIASKQSYFNTVAPHTGAWIETLLGGLNQGLFESHPTRVRGLKPSFGLSTMPS